MYDLKQARGPEYLTSNFTGLNRNTSRINAELIYSSVASKQTCSTFFFPAEKYRYCFTIPFCIYTTDS